MALHWSNKFCLFLTFNYLTQFSVFLFYFFKILLLCDPNCVNVASETEETPLFFAVKSNSMECVELLLSFGANTQSLNLRSDYYVLI